MPIHKPYLVNIYGATIGEDCNIGCFVEIGKASIGNRCKIGTGAFICEGVDIDDDVFIAPGVVFTNVSTPRAFLSKKHEFKKTIVEKGATIGSNSTIVCGVRIGEYSFVGAGAVVTRDVKPYELVYGNPARHQGWVDKTGNRVAQPPEVQVCEVRS